jgi:hypothetical protein
MPKLLIIGERVKRKSEYPFGNIGCKTSQIQGNLLLKKNGNPELSSRIFILEKVQRLDGRYLSLL